MSSEFRIRYFLLLTSDNSVEFNDKNFIIKKNEKCDIENPKIRQK